MSNKEIVKNAIGAYFKGDGNELASYLSTDIVWIQQRGHPIGGIYRGIDEVFEKVFQTFPALWSEITGTVEEIKEDGERVFVTGFIIGTGVVSGRELKAEYLTRYTLKEGKITKHKQYTDTFAMQRTVSEDSI